MGETTTTITEDSQKSFPFQKIVLSSEYSSIPTKKDLTDVVDSQQILKPAFKISTGHNDFVDNNNNNDNHCENEEGGYDNDKELEPFSALSLSDGNLSNQTKKSIMPTLSPKYSLVNSFAGFSPSNNLYEEDIEDSEFNSSFDDPFNSDFLNDDDFETFSFNDMEDIFDHDESSNGNDKDETNNYSTSETEASEDDSFKPSPVVFQGFDEHFCVKEMHHHHFGKPGRRKMTSAKETATQFYNDNSDDEDNRIPSVINNYNSNNRTVRMSKSLDSFPRSPKRIFTPNKQLQPLKSNFKKPNRDSKASSSSTSFSEPPPPPQITFIVSAKNGSLRDATRYATELNSANCEGVRLPSKSMDKIFIPANQTRRNRKKHKKAAVILAQEVKGLQLEPPIMTPTTTTALDNASITRAVGFYSEQALTAYLMSKTNTNAYHFNRHNMTSGNNHLGNGSDGGCVANDAMLRMKRLRRYSSSIQLNDQSVNADSMRVDFGKEKFFLGLNTNSNAGCGSKSGENKDGFAEKTTKRVKWAQKLEW